MRRPRSALPVAALAVAIAVPVASAGGHDTRAAAGRFCDERGKTIVESSVARVYGVTRPVGMFKENRFYGCLRATGDRVRLDRRCSTEDANSLDASRYGKCIEFQFGSAINGRFAALQFDRDIGSIEDHSIQEIVWTRIGPEPVRRRFPLPDRGAGEGAGNVLEQMYVSRRGWVAFSIRFDANRGDEQIEEIGLIPRPGRRASAEYLSLDRGKDVNAHSLRAHHGRITWRTGGAVRHHAWR
jgi:hypothetical protein